MDGGFIGMNAFSVLNYALSVMAFKPDPGPPYAGRRPLRPRRGTLFGSTGFYTGMDRFCPDPGEGKILGDRDAGDKGFFP
jgi:hypothetical protein